MLKMMLDLLLCGVSPVGLDLRLLAKPIQPSWVTAKEATQAEFGLFLGHAPIGDPCGLYPFWWVVGPGWERSRIVALPTIAFDLMRHSISNPSGCFEPDLDFFLRRFPQQTVAQFLARRFVCRIIELGRLDQNDLTKQQIEGCTAHLDHLVAALNAEQCQT